MTQVRLSAELQGHDSDVRCCAGIDEDHVVTGSRDSRLVVWKRELSDQKSFLPERTMTGHQHFVNTVAVLNPKLVVSGSADKTIRIWNVLNGECLEILAEHSAAVCSVQVVKETMEIVSASWDFTARLWQVEEVEGAVKAKCKVVIRGHEVAVWDASCVGDNILTAAADKTIKIWDKNNGAPVATLNSHTDVVRSLAPALEGGFVSVSNDGSMKFWTRTDTSFACISAVSGVHNDNFIYSVDSHTKANGAQIFLSGGEDKTARIVAATDSGSFEAVASMAHPGTVWCVSFLSNGDVLTGCSDGVARIFTSEPSRVASEDVIKAYEGSLAEGQVSTKVIGGVNVAKLPEAETALSEPGTKDGENKIVRRGNIPEVHMWSSSESRWIKVGDVVDGPGGQKGESGAAGIIDGVPYDFVFDVEVGDSGPKQKLGYNRGENSYVAAQRFIEKHELNPDHLDEIAKFIDQNVGADDRLIAAPAMASDPYTGSHRYVPGSRPNPSTTSGTGIGDGSPLTASRYRPGTGTTTQTAPSAPTAARKNIPASAFVLFGTTDQQAKMAEKLRENNNASTSDGSKLTEIEITKLVEEILPSLCVGKESYPLDGHVELVAKAQAWIPDLLVPVLDLTRLAIVHPKWASALLERNETLDMILKVLSAETSSAPSLILASRFVCNLFATTEGKACAKTSLEVILSAVKAHACVSTNKKVRATMSAVILNYAIFLQDSHESFAVVETATNHIVSGEKEEEVLYRLLVAVGTSMASSKNTVAKAQECGVAEAATACAPISVRLRDCANEIAQLLVQ